MKYQIKKSDMIYFPIYLYIFNACNYMIFYNSVLDELLLILSFIIYLCYSRRIKINKSIKIFLVYMILTMIIVIINQSSLVAYLREVVNNIKILLVFLLCYQYKIDNIVRDKIYRIYIVSTIPSILYALCYQFPRRNQYWLYGLKPRNGVGRLSGLTGHPIWFAAMLVFTIIIIIELDIFQIKQPKYKMLKYIFFLSTISLLVFLLECSKSRFSLLVFCIYVAFKIMKKLGDSMKKKERIISIIVLLFSAVIIGLVLLPVIELFVEDFIQGETSSVRMQGFFAIPNAIFNFPLGSGIGTFGGESSIIYDSKVYSVLGMSTPSIDSSFGSGNLFESTLTQRVVEMGILGAVLFFYIVLYPLSYYKYTKTIAPIIMLLIYGTVLIVNTGYQMTTVCLAAVSASNLVYNRCAIQNKISKNMDENKVEIIEN